jgi:hypothetical protein
MNPPSVDVRTCLELHGITYSIGNTPLNPSLLTFGATVGGTIPKPDNLVVVYDSIGNVQTTSFMKVVCKKENVQIIIRSTEYITGYDKAKEIEEILGSYRTFVLDYNYNLVLPVYSLGKDENDRFLFGVRLDATRYGGN